MTIPIIYLLTKQRRTLFSSLGCCLALIFILSFCLPKKTILPTFQLSLCLSLSLFLFPLLSSLFIYYPSFFFLSSIFFTFFYLAFTYVYLPHLGTLSISQSLCFSPSCYLCLSPCLCLSLIVLIVLCLVQCIVISIISLIFIVFTFNHLLRCQWFFSFSFYLY